MTLSGVASVDVKVATPAALLVPVPPEDSVALPVAETATALPATGLPYWSRSVTVTVAVCVPSASWVDGLAVTV